jgi:error-prone DNA polymerase
MSYADQAGYAELQVLTNFSFLEGASHPGELVRRAKELGLYAIGIADRNSLAGVVRAHRAAKKEHMRLVVGARLDLVDGPSMLCYPTDRAAYGRLSSLLTLGQGRADKGKCRLFLADLFAHAEGQILIIIPGKNTPHHQLSNDLKKIKQHIDNNIYLSIRYLYYGDDAARILALSQLGDFYHIPLVVTGDILMHDAARKPMSDVLACIGEGVTLERAGFRLEANGERHLKAPQEMTRLFRGYAAAMHNSVDIADKCRFSLEELRYNYPGEPVPRGYSPQEYLEELAWGGIEARFSSGLPKKVSAMVAHELELIGSLNYASYFLTVYDIVKFARGQQILCQGRGSAANSVVCYALGITSVNPVEVDLLFERFISAERGEPPDIDVDFEHERREEVIQYIYARYGRHRAALAATVVRYRYKSGVREVGKVMGLCEDTVSALAGTVWGHHGEELMDNHVRQAGLDPADGNLMQVLALTQELRGFPRHLSQHVGGFVLTETPLSEVVPIGNAAMEDRTVIEWDKDDLDALGILKIDVLALGMLSAIRKCFDLLRAHYGMDLSLARVPRDDAATYEMLCKADSLGVFQVESRAQMNMLPRLKPRNFYDLVIEVAIVRPGPIQGDMVHPYLRRRSGAEVVDYPSPAPEFGPTDELRQVLHKTLGVPLFQEQAMRIAIVAAGFTPAEADQLRRAMATFRHMGTINSFRAKLVEGMIKRGYDRGFAERCFKQIEGFGEYGFPESHAASFALLVYVSSWLKCHYPEIFACGLLNSQPMGFYAPAQIVRDAREHGVEVLAVDVNHSRWDNQLQPGKRAPWALRLGFRHIGGFREDDANLIVDRRGAGVFDNVSQLQRRAGLSLKVLERLAAGDAFRSMKGVNGCLDRRQALWAVKALTGGVALPLFSYANEQEMGDEPAVTLPQMPLSEHVVNDYQTLRLSLKAHPLSFMRTGLRHVGAISAHQVERTKNGAKIIYGGAVLVRQRPGTAKGVMFMTLEDETGVVNAIVWPKIMEKYRHVIMASRLIMIKGTLQKAEGVTHLIADELYNISEVLNDLACGVEPQIRPGRFLTSIAPQPRTHPRNVRVMPKRLNKSWPKSRDFR